jgi:hypothetical protein
LSKLAVLSSKGRSKRSFSAFSAAVDRREVLHDPASRRESGVDGFAREGFGAGHWAGP